MFKKIFITLFCLCAVCVFSSESKERLKAVVFDYNGVISAFNQNDYRELCEKEWGEDIATLDVAYEEYKNTVKDANYCEDELWAFVSRWIGKEIPKGWIEKLTSFIEENFFNDPKMLSLIQDLKEKNLKIYLLTNSWAFQYKILKDKGDFDCFDEVFVSCVYGLSKPDPKFFKAVLAKTGHKASECFFIDDKKVNVEAA
ncbi:hypothetical protein COB11_05375, partial [Candidatus Aerophobetes bacterium]